MKTILYTDTDQIRSVFGLDLRDLPDATITDRNLEKELSLNLAGWLSSHSDLYTVGVSSGATDTEKNTADAIALYSTYFCCDLLVNTVKLAAPQSVSDGKNSMSRFTPSDWRNIEEKIQERVASYKKLVQELISASTSSQGYTMFSGAGLSIDPVTTTQ